MRVWGSVGVGVLLVLLGGLWSLQGVGIVGGSFMSGDRLWLFIGIVVVLAGLGLLLSTARARRRGGAG
ncbi:MAG: hypothetical protein ACT4O0_02065 [Pseudonocardia sp.]|jgi:hypothetical protein